MFWRRGRRLGGRVSRSGDRVEPARSEKKARGGREERLLRQRAKREDSTSEARKDNEEREKIVRVERNSRSGAR